jgi:hypothetical protein
LGQTEDNGNTPLPFRTKTEVLAAFVEEGTPKVLNKLTEVAVGHYILLEKVKWRGLNITVTSIM